MTDGRHAGDLTHVETMKDAERHLSTKVVDIILLDLGLPDTQGLEAVRRARVAAPNAALVVMTGLDDESVAEQTLKEGAQDYLIKGQIDSRGLLRAMRYAAQRKAIEDISDTEKRLMTHSAQHDFLTGLPNRMLLNDRVRQAIAVAPRHKKKVALLFLDLDGFKQINDSMGHLTGDKLLQSIATRLLECVRGSDTVSRQGGDEFVVLLSEVEDAEGAAITARRMLDKVGDLHFIDPHALHVTSSIGVSLYPDHGADAETLIQNADFAMYTAKQNGRKNYQFFEASKDAGTEIPESKDATSRRKILAPDMGIEEK
jgi:diguanylate cyclase (GGDEF)-like protein